MRLREHVLSVGAPDVPDHDAIGESVAGAIVENAGAFGVALLDPGQRLAVTVTHAFRRVYASTL